MDIKKSGGPAFPTLQGGVVDDNLFRFEGMTLFDYYAAALLAGGAMPDEAIDDAADMVRYRNEYLYGTGEDDESDNTEE